MKIAYLCLALAISLRPASLLAGSIRTDMVSEWKAEAAAGRVGPMGRPAPARNPPGSLDDVIEGLFQRYPVTHILVGDAVDIYIGDEGIYFLQRKMEATGNVENAAASANWNFAVTPEGVFEWQTGQKSGLKIARKDGEIIG
jgi:hypothetical protein